MSETVGEVPGEVRRPEGDAPRRYVVEFAHEGVVFATYKEFASLRRAQRFLAAKVERYTLAGHPPAGYRIVEVSRGGAAGHADEGAE